MATVRVLERFLTRDMSLMAVECWYEGGSKCFKRFFGVSFPDRAYLHTSGVFEFYTNLEDFYSPDFSSILFFFYGVFIQFS